MRGHYFWTEVVTYTITFKLLYIYCIILCLFLFMIFFPKILYHDFCFHEINLYIILCHFTFTFDDFFQHTILWPFFTIIFSTYYTFFHELVSTYYTITFNHFTSFFMTWLFFWHTIGYHFLSRFSWHAILCHFLWLLIIVFDTLYYNFFSYIFSLWQTLIWFVINRFVGVQAPALTPRCHFLMLSFFLLSHMLQMRRRCKRATYCVAKQLNMSFWTFLVSLLQLIRERHGKLLTLSEIRPIAQQV